MAQLTSAIDTAFQAAMTTGKDLHGKDRCAYLGELIDKLEDELFAAAALPEAEVEQF